MIDQVDGRAGHCSHLFLPSDVDLAASRALSWTPTPTLVHCQICGAQIDLTPHVSKAMAEDLGGEPLPPVRGWRKRS